MPQTILVIEDEPNVADNLTYALETEGFVTYWCATGGEGLAKLAASEVDLVVLDVGLPDVDGFEVCRNIRKAGDTPVLFLTARDSEIDRVVGLEIGADDYVSKPFSPREVTARVKAILRRTAPRAGRGNTAGSREAASAEPTPAQPTPAERTSAEGPSAEGALPAFRVDEARHEIHWGDVLLDLTRNEFKLLACLLDQPGRVFTRELLMQHAWEDPGSATARTVDAHVRRVRAKLRDILPEGEVIQTVRGIGYTFRPRGPAPS